MKPTVLGALGWAEYSTGHPPTLRLTARGRGKCVMNRTASIRSTAPPRSSWSADQSDAETFIVVTIRGMQIDAVVTERLTCRPPEPDDEPYYVELTSSPEVGAWLRPPPLDPFGPADAVTWLESDIAHWYAHGFGPWLLFDRARGGFVGRAGLRWTEVDGERAIEVAWALVPEWWGKGLATEAAVAAIGVARERGIRRLVAFTLPDNVASRRVMEKAGLRFSREMEHAGLPHVLYEVG
jgi:RimJ/RimL family protein N-acetyltransferase